MLKAFTMVVAAVLNSGAGSQEPPRPEPFAVVELFTSEGCSSCPPADRVLGRLVTDAAKEGTRIFPLAFHVSYWDSLGWKDPYAGAEATKRQREYAAAFEGAGVYTPQMIVNGSDQFVGSDAEHARASIAAALKAEAMVGIAATAVQEGDRVRIRVEVGDGGNREGLVLVAALVQRGLASEVKAGENAGRKLTHENVVRDFAVLRIGPAGSAVDAELRVPGASDRSELGVIVYVQDRATRRIVGAARANLTPKP